ncbi:MAG: SCO family protein [Vicinamibacteria bacterium]
MTTEPLPRRSPAVVVVFGLLAVLGLVAAAAGLYLRRERPADLPVLGTVPSFTLIERSHRTVTLDDLRGRPWVAGFIFTRCGGICPAMTARMKDLRAAAPLLDLVSFSVDPEHDTPEVLQSYARQHAIGERWFLLTGTTAELHALARDGFRLAAAAVPPEEQQAQGDGPFLHSSRLVLVDGEARIRGYYDSADGDAMAALRRDLARLQLR